jgi:hypothetical protein
MANKLVRRDQFTITPQGIIHKPTDAAFTPYPASPFSGNIRLGRLGNVPANDDDYRAEDVEMLMEQLWAEYVAANPDAFK